MTEATRLTRRGRLAEATALIGRFLRGAKPHSTVETPPRQSSPAVVPDLLQPKGALHLGTDVRNQVVGSAGAFTMHTFNGVAGRRDFKLYVPAAYHGQAFPLVVMLHGCTQSADDFAGGTNMNALADEFGCFVVYPIQSKAANGAGCWNWFNPRDQQRDAGEPAIAVGIVRQVAHDYNVDSTRVYAAGLSAGGAAAAVLGAQYPDVFAAVGVHSGVACGLAHDVPSAFAAMHGRAPKDPTGSADDAPRPGGAAAVPTIVFHGDRDRTVHPSNGDRLVAAGNARTHAASVETKRVAGGHTSTLEQFRDGTGRLVVERWTVHGLGHAWSGGNPAHSYTDPAGPDASRAMLQFFLAHHHQKREGRNAAAT